MSLLPSTLGECNTKPWDSCVAQLGFLCYSAGISVVLKGDLLLYSFSSYVCISAQILNDLSHFVTANADAQMAMAHLVESSFIFNKNSSVCKTFYRFFKA